MRAHEVNDAIDRYRAIQQYYPGRKVVITETGSQMLGQKVARSIEEVEEVVGIYD